MCAWESQSATARVYASVRNVKLQKVSSTTDLAFASHEISCNFRHLGKISAFGCNSKEWKSRKLSTAAACGLEPSSLSSSSSPWWASSWMTLCKFKRILKASALLAKYFVSTSSYAQSIKMLQLMRFQTLRINLIYSFRFISTFRQLKTSTGCKQRTKNKNRTKNIELQCKHIENILKWQLLK